jgi:hypothetical protein
MQDRKGKKNRERERERLDSLLLANLEKKRLGPQLSVQGQVITLQGKWQLLHGEREGFEIGKHWQGLKANGHESFAMKNYD